MKDKLNFLFVDDSDIDNSYIRTLIEIEELPIDAQFAPSAIHALEYLQKLNGASFPQIIIIDINMPLMNGFEFVEKYRKNYYEDHADTKIFISSSSRRLSEIEKVKKIDIVEGFIEKPISKSFIEKNIYPIISNKSMQKLKE